MLSIALNPYFDAVLRAHVVRAARRNGLSLEDLERLLDSEAEAIEYLKGCGIDTYEAYVEAASAAVNHVGWIITPARDPRAKA